MYWIELMDKKLVGREYSWDSDRWMNGILNELTRAEKDALAALLVLVCASHPSFEVFFQSEKEIAELMGVSVDILVSAIKKARAHGKIRIEERKVLMSPDGATILAPHERDSGLTNPATSSGESTCLFECKVLSIPGLSDIIDDEEGETEGTNLVDLIEMVKIIKGRLTDMINSIEAENSRFKADNEQVPMREDLDEPDKKKMDADDLAPSEEDEDEEVDSPPLILWKEDRRKLRGRIFYAYYDLNRGLQEDCAGRLLSLVLEPKRDWIPDLRPTWIN